MSDSEKKSPPAPRAPTGLAAGGRALWRAVVSIHTLDAIQLVQLTEACRQKDRLDKLDAVLRGDVDTWVEIATDFQGVPISLNVSGALSKANETANTMKQLIAALRLPDAAGVRPQQRGPRGAQRPTVPGGAPAGTVTSMDRHRARAEASTGA